MQHNQREQHAPFTRIHLIHIQRAPNEGRRAESQETRGGGSRGMRGDREKQTRERERERDSERYRERASLSQESKTRYCVLATPGHDSNSPKNNRRAHTEPQSGLCCRAVHARVAKSRAARSASWFQMTRWSGSLKPYTSRSI